jgi:hypothetical protein
MWLCTAVTSIPFDCRALMTGFTSSAVSTKSPVVAALLDPVGTGEASVSIQRLVIASATSSSGLLLEERNVQEQDVAVCF